MGFEKKIDTSAELLARITHIRKDRFIPHSLAADYLLKFEELLCSENPKHYLLTGLSGNGKSELAKHFIRKHPVDLNAKGDAAFLPAIRAFMPEESRLGEFGEELLDAMMHSSPRGATAAQKLRMARKLVTSLNVKIVFIDEIQHLATGGPTNRAITINALKRFTEDSGASVVAIGMPKILGIVKREPQLNRRFKKIALPPWKADQEGRSLIHQLETDFQLVRPAFIANDRDLCHYIITLSDGVLQHIVDIMRQAAEIAVRTGKERIDRAVIASLNWVKDTDQCYNAAHDMGISATAVGLETPNTTGNSKRS